MKTLALLLAATTLAITGCGGAGSKAQYRRDCRDAGGEVTLVGTQATCLKDGAVIAKWDEYK